MAYVKEVQSVIDAGVSEEIAIALYDLITAEFEYIAEHPETEQFRSRIASIRKHELAFFRSIIDGACAKYPLPVELNWRKVIFKPKRVTRCEVCMNYFYDVSRNGRSLTCSKQCARNYRNYTRTGGTAIDPRYSRQVQEIPVDFSPDSDDEFGHAMLDEVEEAEQQRLYQQDMELMRRLYSF
ncbi:hypothetical protein [Lentibacillus daqui]|uniref:hypothetical protein n=1 Tax=Lentibacillus daqui TaxID=2911514 RepID=UPI0022B2088D|nr:hypothetical protein [Lentibacillus daqui]